MNEHCAEGPASPTGADVAETRTLGISQPSMASDRASGIVFLGAVVITQVSWLGALVYMTFKLL